ncbi:MULTISPECIES: hypothetical protein [unclassified Bartonella]|nr:MULTISPECIES: hypothetical protein [unclassified Bartonella]
MALKLYGLFLYDLLRQAMKSRLIDQDVGAYFVVAIAEENMLF